LPRSRCEYRSSADHPPWRFRYLHVVNIERALVCIAPTNFEEYETKNELVFEYLNKSYGNQWQKEIKPSVLGFEKWKKK
jgi:hypothetical protein